MQDEPPRGWGPPRDVADLFDTFQRVLTQQNEAWLSVLRKATAGGYTPSQWVADMSEMAQQWYSEVKDHTPGRSPTGGRDAGLPSLQFDLDREAEGADAKPMQLPRPLGDSPPHATPLRPLDDVPVPQGPRVTVEGNTGDSRLLVGLAGLSKLVAGRYVCAIEDDAGRIVGIVFVTRA
jgi:hypothetical protein